MSFKDLKDLIPIRIRKKIKHSAQKLFASKLLNPDIDNLSLTDWSSQNKSTGFDLIELSVISWDYRFQRPQQLAKVISGLGNRVFYIENEFLPTKNTQGPFKARRICERIYSVTLSASKNLFIYADKPSPEDLKIVRNSLKNLIKTTGIRRPVFKIDHPFWSYFINDWEYPIIYDCMDLHSAFSIRNKNIQELESKIIGQSRAIIASSGYLQKMIQKQTNKPVFLLRNGVDYDFFSKAQNKIPKPVDSNKIVGYYGAINEWIDDKAIETIAKNRPDISIVLLGRVQNRKILDLSKRYKNIILFGEKPYYDIPAYLKWFDVCLIPFKLTELIMATNPVKLYEYFSQGKPVLSPEIPEIKPFKDLVYLYNEQNIIKMLELAIADKSNKINSRIDAAKNNTWQQRGNELEKIIQELL